MALVAARPAPWTWPLIALGLTFPITLVHAGFANPTLWMAAFAALGLRYALARGLDPVEAVPAAVRLIGIRSRGWWLVAGGLAVASLPFLADTLIYPRVVLDAQGGGLLLFGPRHPVYARSSRGVAGRRRESAAPR